MTTARKPTIIRTVSAAVATAAMALLLTAYPAEAMRPDPLPESVAGASTSLSAAPVESGIPAGPVAAGTAVGLLVGAGAMTLALRGRRQIAHHPAAA